MGEKRSHDAMTSVARAPESTSRYQSVFEAFRDDLDRHQDRRERIIKASRDITAASKKIIFALQRVRTLGQPLPQHIQKATAPHYEAIFKAFKSIVNDLQGINAHRYARNITGGLQEFLEAISFQHYLETQTLITVELATEKLNNQLEGLPHIGISHADYILGLYDMTGELMRFAITTMATTGNVLASKTKEEDGDVQMEEPPASRSVLADLRETTFRLETLDTSGEDYGLRRDCEKKLSVSQASVEKVEKAVYGLVVRGSERPKGWMPDVNETRAGEDTTS